MKAAIIGGVLAGAAGALVLLLRWLGRRRRQGSADVESAEPVGSSLSAPEPRAFLWEQTPQEAVQVIESVPPKEREALAQRAFVGRWVKWSGRVSNVRNDSTGKGFRVSLTTGRGPMLQVMLPLSERAAVEVLRPDDRVVVEARVDEIRLAYWELVNGRIVDHQKPSPPSA